MNAAPAALDPRAADVLAYWFGRSPDDARVIDEKGDFWFSRNAQTDAEIRTRYATLREDAVDGHLHGWCATMRGRLALVILVDQFSRNLFRDDARAFVHDALARTWLDEALRRRADRELRLIERAFFYLPLQHSESFADQHRSVALYDELLGTAPPALRARFADYLGYAERHCDLIARFGRFPHRNAALGRPSTPAELAFLAEPDSAF